MKPAKIRYDFPLVLENLEERKRRTDLLARGRDGWVYNRLLVSYARQNRV